ncbi:glutathione S-transferase family protein, partial [Candidatus Parcubacteria bacterium]
DFYPTELREEIDELNAFVYEHVNNGVYLCGFATAQEAYDEAFDALFSALDELEARLANRTFLVGERLTEADVRLFPTLIRFDAVYYCHFKCNRNHIFEMPNLWRYLKRLWAIPAFRDTTDFEHIKQHYYYSHASLNPSRIVPKGPRLSIG